MADDKKNIGPVADKPCEAPQKKKAEPIKDTPLVPEQLSPSVPQNPVVEATPKVQTVPMVESQSETKCPRARKRPARRLLFPQKLEATSQEAQTPEQGQPAAPRDATRAD